MKEIVQAIENLAEVIENNSLANQNGDGTGWTIADSLENIASELIEINNTLKFIRDKL